jgi:hypothetical protein
MLFHYTLNHILDLFCVGDIYFIATVTFGILEALRNLLDLLLLNRKQPQRHLLGRRLGPKRIRYHSHHQLQPLLCSGISFVVATKQSNL